MGKKNKQLINNPPEAKLKKTNIYILIFIISISMFFIGFYFGGKGKFLAKRTETRQRGYQLISPLIDCSSDEVTGYNAFIDDLRSKVLNLLNVNSQIEASVYFRDLNNGPILNINPKKEFYPASLTKIPVMMAYFKYAEDHPGIMKKYIVYEKKIPREDEVIYRPAQKLVVGTSYSVEELLYRMIVYSDNASRELLIKDIFNNIGKNELAVSINAYSDIFEALLLTSPDSPAPKMKASEVASFFRTLYNASYLNRKYSEKALNILGQVDFRDGLKSNLPSKTVIAHKFGEDFEENYRHLHDCGIIYFPKKPYLLCVMTKGLDNKGQAELISKVSKLVHDEVSLSD